jgi:hypothetical protein
MIERRRFNELAGADHGWLQAKHHFSFGEHADATRMGWGSLRASGTTTRSRPTRASRPTRLADAQRLYAGLGSRRRSLTRASLRFGIARRSRATILKVPCPTSAVQFYKAVGRSSADVVLEKVKRAHNLLANGRMAKAEIARELGVSRAKFFSW